MLHIDGARSWNAAVASGLDMKTYLGDADLISVCMSKGMGTPVGSFIVGSEKNIARAKTLRKMLGGGMRQTGILSAAGLVALEDWETKIRRDNDNCTWMAHEIATLPGVILQPELNETNILRFCMDKHAFKKAGIKD